MKKVYLIGTSAKLPNSILVKMADLIMEKLKKEVEVDFLNNCLKVELESKEERIALFFIMAKFAKEEKEASNAKS